MSTDLPTDHLISLDQIWAKLLSAVFSNVARNLANLCPLSLTWSAVLFPPVSSAFVVHSAAVYIPGQWGLSISPGSIPAGHKVEVSEHENTEWWLQRCCMNVQLFSLNRWSCNTWSPGVTATKWEVAILDAEKCWMVLTVRKQVTSERFAAIYWLTGINGIWGNGVRRKGRGTMEDPNGKR